MDAFWGLTVLIKKSIFFGRVSWSRAFQGGALVTDEPLVSLCVDLFKSMFLRGYWPEIFSEGRMLPANDRS